MVAFKNKIGFLVALIVFLNTTMAQFNSHEGNAKLMGMGNVQLFSTNATAALFNPAAFNSEDQLNISTSISPSPIIANLAHFQAAANHQFKKENFVGLALSNYGSPFLREQWISATYAKGFNNWSIGGRMNILHLSQADNIAPNKVRLTSSIGSIIRLQKSVQLGLYIDHLNQGIFGENRVDKALTQFHLGMNYKVSSTVQILSEAEKSFFRPLNIKAGITYRPHPLIDLRTGVQSYPTRFSAGMGINWKGIALDYGFQYQNILGTSHAVGLTYGLAKKKE